MKTKSFLLILILAGTPLSMYCAEDEFEKNIELPLIGEPLDPFEIPSVGYSTRLATSAFLFNMIPTGLGMSYCTTSAAALPEVALPAVALSAVTALVGFSSFLGSKSAHEINHYTISHLHPAIEAHNAAINHDNPYEGMIYSVDGNRVLTMWRDNSTIVYPYDQWRKDRREAVRGFDKNILFGYENLILIDFLNRKLNTLDEQLRPVNIKKAKRD